MHPLIAAFIPILLLGTCIAFLLVRLQNKSEQAKDLEAKLRSLSKEKVVRREESSDEGTAAPALKKSQSTEKENVYFDASDSLLATLSHELKTPLNCIMGISQILREENEHSDQIIELEGCAVHMHSVLHTLTNLARIQNENEYLPQYREWVSLRDTIEQIKEDVTFRARGHQVKIRTEHPNTRIRLRGDSDHIETLIKSAILGSIEAIPLNGLPEERETLTVSWEQYDDEFHLRIDNPLEVLEDEREEAINKILTLARGEAQTRVKIEYLHMAVARALLKFYKGSHLTEELPTGGVRTTIGFTMEHMVGSPSAKQPIGGLRVQSGKSGIKALNELPETLKILVAEDDRASRNLILMLLEKMGQDVVFVENGEEAVIALQKLPDFDLILMDVDMPVMDGMAATQAIRNGLAGDEVKDIPIVAVTAFNVISDRSRFKEAGMGYYLPKPVCLKGLRATLLEIAKKNRVEH